jgi:hypothetical protein
VHEPIPDVGVLAKEMEARLEAEEAVAGAGATTAPTHAAEGQEVPGVAAGLPVEGDDAPAPRAGGATEGA